MSFYITRQIELDMGHRIPNHASQCRFLHGHRYRVVATLAGTPKPLDQSSDSGMVMDYGDLKAIMMACIHKPLDHGFMVYDQDPLAHALRQLPDQKLIFVPFIPTAENIAQYLFGQLKANLPYPEQLVKLTVWETPNCSASYCR